MSTFNPTRFNEELLQFTGSENLYQTLIPGVRYTDGVKYVADQCQSYWLIDLIASYQRPMFVAENRYQVWILANRENSATIICEDGNDNEICRQTIGFTDFPLDEFTLWCTDGVILLPGEY